MQEKRPKGIAMKRMAFITICLLASLAGFAKDRFSVIPRDEQYVYVVALEKEALDEPSSQWNPTLYRIDVIEAKIVARLKIAEQGSPIYCQRLGYDQIRIYIHEGTASNGSFPGTPLTKEIVVDKYKMAIINEKITTGHSEYEFQQPDRSTYSEKLKKKGLVLGEFIKGKIFLYALPGDERLLKTVGADSLDEIQSIPIVKNDLKLGGFGGQINTAWWGEQKVVLLFDGNSHLGFFAPSYVVIIDVITKQVQYIPIGSNHAEGIAY